MIPTFLQSIAAAVRDLVRTGKAVHVTEQTAAECELLAGLPWDGVMYELADLPRSTMQPIAPADIALGWLLCSKAPLIQGFIVSRETSAMRAAECAELAVIAAELPPCALSVEVARDAHKGTREGARAAWGFIHEQIRTEHRGIGLREVGSENLIDRYRRELEAM